MKSLINHLVLIVIRILGKFGKRFNFRNKILSSQKILEKNFPESKTFNFIQVGANDGISFDFLYEFVIDRKSEGIVVEPVSEYFDELVVNYKKFPKIVKINKAVHNTEKIIEINKISPSAKNKYPDWVKGIASLNAEHHKKTDIDSNDIVKEKVQADTLMNIIDANLNNKRLDYFQVDTEGYDFEIIKMIDFKVIRPLVIKYESVNLNEDDRHNLLLLLKKHGYYLFNELGDTVGIDLNKIRLF